MNTMTVREQPGAAAPGCSRVRGGWLGSPVGHLTQLEEPNADRHPH
jgi:hypothetical protein